LAANSASVKSPWIASSATFALKSADYRFLVVFIPSVPLVGISLAPFPEKPAPPHEVAATDYRTPHGEIEGEIAYLSISLD
jgi:hypothetical protein